MTKSTQPSNDTSDAEAPSEPRHFPPARQRTRGPTADTHMPNPPEVSGSESRQSESPQSKPDYDVGFGKPPAAHRWQKGVSGNPKGRVKGSRNVATIWANRLNDRIKTKVNGKVTTETALEAIIRGQVYDALTTRDHRKVVHLLGEVDRLRIFNDDDESGSSTPVIPSVDESDAEIVRRLMDRLSGRDDKQ
jgi:hypothetical protein